MKPYDDIGLDSKLKRDSSLAARPRKFQGALEQDVDVEKTPFANPTTVVKGDIRAKSGGTLTLQDVADADKLSYNPTTGAITLDGPVTFNDAVTFTAGSITMGISPQSFVSEASINLLSAGASSGAQTSYYTDATSMQNLNATEFQIDPDNFPGCSFYLEAVCRAGANGDSERTFSMDIYDVTGGSALANGTVSTNSTEGSAGPGSLVRARGTSNIRASMVSGDRTYVYRYKSSASSKFVDVYEARLIIDFT